jgi:3-deoxy-D-manno-octulosonic-acid transferase
LYQISQLFDSSSFLSNILGWDRVIAMFDLLYSIGLHFYALITLPKMWLTRRAVKARLGKDFPKVEGPCVWIHGVSLGETKAVTPLARKFKQNLIVTSSTDTGLAEAKRAFPDAQHAYLPFDFSYVVGPIMRRTRPEMLILCEGDLWYRLLKEAKRVGAKTALVNGKISERSAERHRKFPALGRHLFPLLDLVCVQSEEHRKRFAGLGVESEVTGNLKFDGMGTGEMDLSRLKQWAGDSFVVTLGSTHDPEEQQLMEALRPLFDELDLKVLLVPRHPQRFDRVASRLRELEIPFSRYTEEEWNERVLLVDTIGVLRGCYRISHVALVAGSWTARVGGHNILEPLMEGAACLFGPHMHTQRELESLVLEAGAGRQVEVHEVAHEVRELLLDEQRRHRLRERGEDLMERLQGASDRTFERLSEIGAAG